MPPDTRAAPLATRPPGARSPAEDTDVSTIGHAPDTAAFLALSDERDLWRAHADAMWRDGYRAGCAGAADEFSRGYAAAIADVKAVEHGLVNVVRLACRRSRPGGAAWLAEVERHGGTEFAGVGKPRRPIPPDVIEHARQDLGRAAR
jgi:hypothetical protein